jgi:adenine-specific DNA-methyltransferase
MSAGERQLASLAAALIGDTAEATARERNLIVRARDVDTSCIAQTRKQILAGADPLGERFCTLRSPEQRRDIGAVYTPPSIVDAMVEWAASNHVPPARIVDPGTGSGRFLTAAARRFPGAQLIGVDVDPLAMLLLRANASVLGFADRLSINLVDYRALDLPNIDGATLYIGNPPYVRHHDIGERWKTWFAATAARFNSTASKLAGLHVHFFLKTRALARPGDFGAFITAAEWLDVNYGSLLRNMLADGLGGSAIHIIDPKAQPFANALTTGAITCFHVGRRPSVMTMRSVDALADLAPLSQGRPVDWSEISAAPKWSAFVRAQPPAPANFIELGELFRVHRGQVTGHNAVWIEGEEASDIPARFKHAAITRARELLAAGIELRSANGLRRVIDLPPDLRGLDADERRAIEKFLAWARRQGAHEAYVARHRRAWWSVALRDPAPILCTYMARRAPAFVRNHVKARHINIAHGLYPREPLAEDDLMAIVTYLRGHIGTAGGRVYAGGLVKFEPRELERILVPRVEDIHGHLSEKKAISKKMVPRRVDWRRGGGAGCLSE